MKMEIGRNLITDYGLRITENNTLLKQIKAG